MGAAGRLLSLAGLLAACGAGGEALPPVLTLVPAAMEPVGPARPAGPYELCLDPGGAARASVYVHERSVAFRIRARSEDPEREAQLWVRIGAETASPEPIRVHEFRTAAHRVRSAPGQHTLELRVPPTSAAGACVAEVALTQP